MKIVVPVLLLCGLFATAASAQQLPIPGQKNPDWVLQKMEKPAWLDEDAPAPASAPVAMPNAASLGGGVQDSNGQWLIYYDPAHSLRYNLKALPKGLVRVQHTQTGTLYTYMARNPATVRPPQ